MTRTLCTLALLGGLLSRVAIARAEEAQRPPNVVLIFADDMGYADLGCYGAEGIETPNLDRLAKEGTRFTDFYAAQAVCSASRVALLTGCYSNRVGIQGALGPRSKIGINANETTLAEVFKSRGYATAIYGKWHLGDAPQFLPTRHGFDDYFGLPYSNDMWPFHPTSKSYPPLPLIEGEKVKELNPDQRNLTTWYTEHAVRFIEQNQTRPFFLYVPHNMPHVPLFVSDKWKGKSKRGLYGDVIQEIDWSVGEITAALDRTGLDRSTLVIFASDNGPWLSYGDHAGSAGPLREGKGTSFDGGVREPGIFRWRGKIPAGGVCREPAMTIDVLPTLARLIGAQVPTDRIIDGKDIWPLLTRPKTAKSPHEALYIYWGGHLDAVRSGKWKLHLPHEYRSLKGQPGMGGQPGPYVQKQIGTALFDLEKDSGEILDVAAQNPDVVRRLSELAQKAREDLGDTATGQKGTGVRPPGRLGE
jgi:arylsulfatase A-like enzyme